ncbi:MAG: XdhC family protein [Kineosporiaceae bacterium]
MASHPDGGGDMREVLPELLGWWRDGHPVGLATVVATWRSAPRPAGAAMLLGPGGDVVGSVSGGCVEGAVHELSEQVLATGTAVLHRYGVSDDDAFAAGLSCGGILDVFVERITPQTFPELGAVADDAREGRPVAVGTVIAHPEPDRVGRRLVIRPGTVTGTLGDPGAETAIVEDVRGLLATGESRTLEYGPRGERAGTGMRVFVSVLAPRPRMIVFGAIDFAAAVARIGSFLGYRVTVCDARAVFATRSRFAEADEVVVDWPHRYLAAEAAAGRVDGRTALVVLTHDPKFDVPLLQVALRLPEVGYLGAMGSRRTHEDRTRRLREGGVSEVELARLSSPIGLDLGARTPEETAVSIAAEIIALRWGRAAQRLTGSGGPIHPGVVR